MLNLDEVKSVKPFALFNLGFRPFFLFASVFATLSMSIWMLMYFFHVDVMPPSLPAMVWHGHEMVFAYSFAAVCGFLLTAVKNWTGVQTIHGKTLAVLSALWLIPRLLPLTGMDSALLPMAIIDLLFMLFATAAIAHPIIKVRQWQHISIAIKVLLIFAANILFYLALFGVLPEKAINWGLYSGLYLVVSLVLLMGRRVIPFFIEKGVDENVTVINRKWLDHSSLYVFLVFIVIDVFFEMPMLAALFAAILFVLHTMRLVGWHTKGIWKKPLLWVLYVGYGFIILGFGLKSISSVVAMSPWLSIHAFAVGGIGLLTIGMMSRVALGHTGRNVFSPPEILNLVFSLIVAAAVLRVVLPLILIQYYAIWVAMAQMMWIVGFGIFAVVYIPVLMKPRVDGRPG